MHGFGVYSFANGHRYEGSWHEGKRQGLGMYSFRNGETQSGHWQNGVLDVPSSQSAMYPVSPVAVYHSKVLNAIQVFLFFFKLMLLTSLGNLKLMINKSRAKFFMFNLTFMFFIPLNLSLW